MNEIHILDSQTVDQIAAGEVVERPSSVVKELVENAIDAGASHVTVEIKDGGVSFIRVTDDGFGIDKSQLEKAFIRHATSKIQSANDLETVLSLGFRGEALSSILAVSQMELMTKTKDALTGSMVRAEGGKITDIQEAGLPTGTTVIVRQLFYNTPARRKFLKSAQTEGSYIADLLQHIALSKPNVAIQFISNNQTKFFTSGNGNIREIIYSIHGKEVEKQLLEVNAEMEGVKLTGFIGKPILNRSTRSYETFFVNGRYIKSNLLSSSIEEGYRTFMMQHKFPYVCLYFDLDPLMIDVNVHPTKREIRINEPNELLRFLQREIKDTITNATLVQEFNASPFKKEEKPAEAPKVKMPQPFEVERRVHEADAVYTDKPVFNKIIGMDTKKTAAKPEPSLHNNNIIKQKDTLIIEKAEQLTLFEDTAFLDKEVKDIKLLGQVFDTYWLFMLDEKLYFMDQHAAHEKVMYEKFMKQFHEKEIVSQIVNPPMVIELSPKEKRVLENHLESFTRLGFEIEDFGDNSFTVRQVPLDLYGLSEKQLFLTVLDELVENEVKGDSDAVCMKIASMSCKAAVKGNMKISVQEANALIETLFTLENPFNCPHGRPTLISMSRYEMEKKFKR